MTTPGCYQTNLDDNCNTGCWVSQTKAELGSRAEDILDYFQTICRSKEFAEEFHKAGFKNARYVPNDLLTSNRSPCYDRFQSALPFVCHSETLALVFHGTGQSNIASILKNGLDPTYRLGQRFGEGEYFAKDIAFSDSFTKGGKEMLIFVVVLPGQTDLQDKHGTPCPDEYVVVENNAHQIPLGTVRYTSRNPDKIKQRISRIQGTPIGKTLIGLALLLTVYFAFKEEEAYSQARHDHIRWGCLLASFITSLFFVQCAVEVIFLLKSLCV